MQLGSCSRNEKKGQRGSVSQLSCVCVNLCGGIKLFNDLTNKTFRLFHAAAAGPHTSFPCWLNMQFIAQHQRRRQRRCSHGKQISLRSVLFWSGLGSSLSGCSRAKCVARQRKLAHLMRMDETLLPQRIHRGILAIPKIIPTVAA